MRTTKLSGSKWLTSFGATLFNTTPRAPCQTNAVSSPSLMNVNAKFICQITNRRRRMLRSGSYQQIFTAAQPDDNCQISWMQARRLWNSSRRKRDNSFLRIELLRNWKQQRRLHQVCGQQRSLFCPIHGSCFEDEETYVPATGRQCREIRNTWAQGEA